jgi:adenine-specific DNA-methyltransferase
MLADILNSPVANQRFSAVSGSFSVSARLLARLALPNPADIPRGAKARRRALPELFAALEAILVPADR